MFATDDETFLGNQSLMDEVLGPSTLVVQCGSREQMLAAARQLEGQLTATLHDTPEDLAANRDLVTELETKVGRLLGNGFPTGVLPELSGCRPARRIRGIQSAQPTAPGGRKTGTTQVQTECCREKSFRDRFRERAVRKDRVIRPLRVAKRSRAVCTHERIRRVGGKQQPNRIGQIRGSFSPVTGLPLPEPWNQIHSF